VSSQFSRNINQMTLNADESSLFYSVYPDCTVTNKAAICQEGKRSKERNRVMPRTNTNETEKLPPLLIQKYESLCVSKAVKHLSC
jgi:hypothetical protein